MNSLANIFWLGIKDLRALSKDLMMILFIFYSFGISIYMQSTGAGETVHNASVAIVDEDNSALSRSIAGLFYPPYFQAAKMISAADIDRTMDKGLYTLVVVIPPRFEADVRKGRDIEVQVNADATAVQQASLGGGYIQNMVTDEVTLYRQQMQRTAGLSSDLVIRRAFNPNGTQSWFRAVVGLADQLSMLIIILTGRGSSPPPASSSSATAVGIPCANPSSACAQRRSIAWWRPAG